MALALNLAADTTVPKTNRRVYSAEQLQRLRSAESQPKLREAIEKHDSEDAEIVKEHVLRGSKSFAARSFRSRPSTHCLRVPSSRSNIENLSVNNNATDALPRSAPTQIVTLAPSGHHVLGEIAPNNQMLRTGPFTNNLRPSPTPSLKRKKAEAIVKAHGSPTHIRVTAGGRIVPSEQSPLCYPRYGYSAINLNGRLVKFAPTVQAGQPQWTKATEDGFVAQDEHGNLSQIVNGTILPLHEVDGALRLYMPAPNLKVTVQGTQRNASQPLTVAGLEQHSGRQLDAPQNNPPMVPEVSVETQIHALDVKYSKLERELKELDKTEVLHSRSMNRAAKESMYSQRRTLVTGLNKLRLGIKALRSQPPPNAPTSPRAMSARHPMSPRNRLPPFLQMQQQGNIQLPPASQGLNYQAPPPSSLGSQYGVQAPTDESYAGHSWAVPPPGVFAPPSFDGSFSMYAQSTPLVPALQPPIAPPVSEAAVPQNDGARSLADLMATSPLRSRAVSIKAPEAKPTTTLKSSLKPESPVFKPGFGPSRSTVSDHEMIKQNARGSDSVKLPAPQRLPSLLKDSSGAATTSPETTFIVSPSKRSGHLHSSSISSFETADFFPRNPREYSTRQHDYPIGAGRSEDKEQCHKGDASGTNQDSPITPDHGQSIEVDKFRATAAPPGTPVLDAEGHPAIPAKVDGYREVHNVSPKSKREWLFIAENPADPANQPLPSSSPIKPHASLEAVKRIPCSDALDFSQKPREWIMGFQAGLHRRPIDPESNGEYLNGYCSGLLRSKPPTASAPVSVAPSTGSPMKTLSRRPSPAMMSRPSSRLQLVEQAPTATRPPFENAAHSLDTLKQAVYAPQNENAVFTPTPDGPHITGTVPNIGARLREQHNAESPANVLSAFPFPKRTSSVIKQQHRIMSEGNPPQEMGKFQDPRRVTDLSGSYLGPNSMDRFSNQPVSPAMSTMSITSGSESNNSHRVMSLSGIDSNLARQWPSTRIITPIGSSVGHAAGLATGYFASAQFDGAPQIQRATSITSAGPSRPRTGRFREGSIDGDTFPLLSPSTSQQENSPEKTPRGRKNDSSPVKGPSPAKAKFEHIAEKVGIKVSATSAA